ncbi:hypothetical protein [Oceanobacillus sp. J11TS1]|uniref:hypothetical protein n=1 Tax=Oceanobacillus sp. J11TS1 TaxID=2807191 RepID=UPI001B2756F0|nr:hypothetical protein [Oceanobacillus sp. J11TS1]GIO23663.1 hypothetical protein J11TS1_22440 [Oceanobacillus sp. J11TS1]
MKKIISIILVIFALFLLVSCSNKDEVADEIIQYYNEEWIPINDMKEKELRDLPFHLNELEEHQQYEEAIALIKDEMIPVADEVIKRLQAVEPENGKVKKLNDLEIEAEQFAKEGLNAVIIYYEGGDISESDVNQYNEDMQEKYQDFFDYRDKLMDKYNLEQFDEEEKGSKFYKIKRAED